MNLFELDNPREPAWTYLNLTTQENLELDTYLFCFFSIVTCLKFETGDNTYDPVWTGTVL
jgi:hypothetical protein